MKHLFRVNKGYEPNADLKNQNKKKKKVALCIVNFDGVSVSAYLFRCSSRVRKVMRLGSGRERRRCIMQFSLAAGSERAETDRKTHVQLCPDSPFVFLLYFKHDLLQLSRKSSHLCPP